LHDISSIRVGGFMTVRVGAALALTVALSGACRDQPLGPVCGDGTCGSEESVTWRISNGYGDSPLDILFVIDDTPAISGTRAALAAAIPQIAQILQSLPGGPPSLHLGVVAASLEQGSGGSGMPRTRADACGLSAGQPFLSTQACGQSPNFGGTFTNALSCLADLGTTASGAAEPLTVMREILDGPSVAGAGWTDFLRPNAYLLLIIVAGEDDASGPPDLGALAAFVRSFKSDPNQVLVSAIVPSATCATSPAASAPLLSTFVEAFGGNGAEGCSPGDLVDALTSQLSVKVSDLIAPECLADIRDIDPTRPGLQANCTVDEAYVSASDGSGSESVVASCDVSGPPCWTFTPGSAGVCPGGWLFTVDRGPGFCPRVLTTTEVTCLGCIDPSDPACSGPPQSDAGP
jgi:hypothetical protein